MSSKSARSESGPNRGAFAVGVQEAMTQLRGPGASWQLVGGGGAASFNSVIKTFWQHE